MKRCINIVVFVISLLIFSVQTFSTDDLSEDLNDLYELVPDEVFTLSETEDIDSMLSITNILKIFLKSLSDAFLKYKSEYLSIFVLIIVVFIYESVGKSLNGKVFEVADIAILLICGLSIFKLSNGIISDFVNKHTQISGYAASATTVSVAAMISSASGASATSLGTVCTLLISVYNYICSTVVLPFSNIYLSMALCGGITGDFNLRRVSSFTRNISIAIVGGFMTLFSGLMSVQSVISMSRDTLLKKTVKQILSTSLPVLGGAVSDGMDTLFTSAIGIKNQAGVVGITVSVLLSLSPISEMLIFFLVLSLIGFILSFFEGVKLSDFISTVRDMVSVLICISLSLTIMTVLLFYFIIRVT